WRGTLFTDGRPARIVCSVRRTGIQVTFDGKTVIDWKGSRDRLALHPNWGVPKPRVLWIGAWDGVFRIMSLTLSPAGGAAKSETPSGQQDLIASIDPARDSVKGAFSKEGGALMTPRETVFSRIAIPVDVPEEYEVTLEAARRSGGDMLGLGVLQNGRQVMAVVGGQSGETGGLEMLDGLNFMLNKTRFEHPFLEVGKPFTVKVTVRKSGIEVVMNGKRVVAWEGDSKALSLYHEWRVPDRTRLFL